MLPRNLGRKKCWLRQNNTNSGHFLSYTITATWVYIRQFLFHLYSHRVLNLSNKTWASWLKEWQMCKFRLVFTHTPQLGSLLRMLCKTLSLPSYRTTFGTMQELPLWIFCPRAIYTAEQWHRALLGQCYTNVKQNGFCSKRFTLWGKLFYSVLICLTSLQCWLEPS